MTPKQTAAIKTLELAFRTCKAAGLSFCGMDNELYAYDGEMLDEAEKRVGCLHGAQTGMMDSKSRHIVKTHGTYLDSGGW